MEGCLSIGGTRWFNGVIERNLKWQDSRRSLLWFSCILEKKKKGSSCIFSFPTSVSRLIREEREKKTNLIPTTPLPPPPPPSRSIQNPALQRTQVDNHSYTRYLLGTLVQPPLDKGFSSSVGFCCHPSPCCGLLGTPSCR